MTDLYKIVRFYQRAGIPQRIIARGLTLGQAQAHCSGEWSCSSTATTSRDHARTSRVGPWFDGYRIEDND